jgi:hypothetical protein
VGAGRHAIFSKKTSRVKKGSGRQCVVVMQQPVLLSPKIGAKSWELYALSCQDMYFVNNPLDVKENDKHASDLALHPSCLFSLTEFGLFHSNTCIQLMLSSANACLMIARFSVAHFPGF